jgi:hypothetical protein
MYTTSNNKCKLLSTITLFFLILEHLLFAFIFSSTRYFLINAWCSKSIRPIITSLCVPCTAMWKHLISSLWMNMIDFIFRLFHIRIRLILFILIPLRLPYTCSANYAHLSIDCENTSGECTYFFANFAHNFDDCANIPYNWMNIAIDSANTLDISYVDFYMPNFVLLQLLLF